MTADRGVLDTHVLVSAAIWPQNAPRSAVDAVAGRGGVLVFSEETFEEPRTRLLKAKFETRRPAQFAPSGAQ